MNIYVIIAIAVAGVVLIGLAFFAIHKVNYNSRKKKAEIAIDKKVEDSAGKLSSCFGGKENIESISQKGSRVVVIVKDNSLVDKDEINKELSSVMFMNNKIVFVIGSKSEEFSKLLQENVDKIQ